MPSTTTPNVTASYKSSTLPATSDSALDGVDVNEQRKIEADIKRAKAAAATPAKAAAATPAKAARPGQEESGVVKKKRKLRRKSGKRSDDDDDEEEYKDVSTDASSMYLPDIDARRRLLRLPSPPSPLLAPQPLSMLPPVPLLAMLLPVLVKARSHSRCLTTTSTTNLHLSQLAIISWHWISSTSRLSVVALQMLLHGS
jgi:hypothetical protein